MTLSAPARDTGAGFYAAEALRPTALDRSLGPPTMSRMSSGGDAPRIVLITHPRDGATELARALVEARLAACVNLVEVASVYRWEGATQQDPEVLLVAKTTAEHIAGLERALDERHPYDVPECIALDPAHVEAKYLAWMRAATRDA